MTRLILRKQQPQLALLNDNKSFFWVLWTTLGFFQNLTSPVYVISLFFLLGVVEAFVFIEIGPGMISKGQSLVSFSSFIVKADNLMVLFQAAIPKLFGYN